MSASTNPFTVQGALSFPPDDGAQLQSLPFSISGTYTAVMDERLTLAGASTDDVAFGTVANVKALLVEYPLVEGAAAIQLHVNGSTDGIELSPGGLIVYASPTPTVGISALSIEHTVDAVVRVRLLG